MQFFRRPGNNQVSFRPPDLEQERRGNHLLVWREIPYWTVVDRELLGLLQSLDGSRTLNDIIAEKSLPGDVAQFLTDLSEKGILSDSEDGVARKSKALDPHPPIENISINLTRRCNLRCSFCYNLHSLQNDRTGELSAAEIKGVLREARKLSSKTCSFVILGGEPFLRPDELFDVSREAVRMGLTTLVSTNGTLVNDETAGRAAEIGLQVQVSLDGHTAKLNDGIRGNGSFDKALRGVKALVRNGVYTILSMVCHGGNIDHLEDYYRFADSLGVNEARFIPLKQIGGAQAGCLSPASMREQLLRACSMLKRNPEFVKLTGRDAFSILGSTCRHSTRRLSCGTGLQTFLLDSDGSIYPCLNTSAPEFRAANIRDSGFDFRRVWRDSPVLRNIRHLTNVNNMSAECSSCPVQYWCLGGCHGETYASTGSLNTTPPNCEDWKQAIIEMLWILSERPDLIKTTSTIC